jgi:CelD/BcsL family acetyltransferase involved in cellulose biosynthesis
MTPRVDWRLPGGLSPSDVARWRDLAGRSAEPNPFHEPELVLPAIAHLPHARVRLLVASDAAGDWLGVLPVKRSALWRRVPTPSVSVWRHPYAFFGSPLVDRDHVGDVVEELVAAGRRRAGGVLALEWIPAGGPVADALRGALDGVRTLTWEQFDRAALVRRAEGGYVESMLKSRRRRELRRQRSALAAELGAELVFADRAGEAAAVEEFLALEASGWKGRAGSALSVARHAGFFRALCARFAEHGRLQLYALSAAGRTVAMKCNLVAGDGVFCFKIAYDEAFARFSPGVQVELDNVGAFHARPELAWMDSCADADNTMINRLWPDRRPIATLLVPARGPAGMAARTQALAAAHVRRRLKEAA